MMIILEQAVFGAALATKSRFVRLLDRASEGTGY